MEKSCKSEENNKKFKSENSIPEISMTKEHSERISEQEYYNERSETKKRLNENPTEEHLWETCLAYSGATFKTYSGLSFSYEIRRGKSGKYTRELWIDRRENSKSLSWSSVKLAFDKVKDEKRIIERPKALGDIRGITYIYGMFYRFGLIDVPEKVKGKMKCEQQ